MQNPTIEAIAKSYYDAKLPYHNFGHILRALAASEKIMERCLTSQVPVDESVVYFALLFHDAGYADDHTKKGFPHKEAYAADIASRELLKNGIEQKLVTKVQHAILATHREANLTTTEEKIVRASDLAAMGSDYEGFRKDAEDLRKEHKFLTGKEMSTEDWKKMVQSHVEFYSGQIIHITSSPNTNTSEFHIHAKENLQRFLKEV